MGKLPFERDKRKRLVRHDAATSEKYGCDPDKRPIQELLEYGIVNLDKPAGPTSHQVSSYVQKILKLRKSGHSGTLDPGVTGVLPVALGRGTRIVQSLLIAGKEYVCLMRLHEERSRDQVERVLKEFTGRIRQMPPVKSAVKRQWRWRKVYYNELLDHQGADVLFKVGCQAGTYIRKLAHDMGSALGCGAHMQELRRTKAGPFKEDSLVTLHDLTDAYAFWKEEGDEGRLREAVQPVERAVSHLPRVAILDTTADALCHGATLKVRGIAWADDEVQPEDHVAVVTLKGELVCVGEARLASKDMVEKESGVAVKSTQVFMRPGTYPKA
ncbi:RNA-guided pseudouridylation complex pseudouridine synthase subunit Cbf5 [Candidatus Woesearchaeota archaeon]|nr:RNA-guided pseudouridylation complex pseudouridine synthase subunit Cbf5 [Candidatus Woesearchaeota archaeon]